MKWWAGFLALLGLSMILNAADGKWAFTERSAGAGLIALDILIGVGFFVASYVLWRKAEHEQLLQELKATQLSEDMRRLTERRPSASPPNE
jgi:hypothetical protein